MFICLKEELAWATAWIHSIFSGMENIHSMATDKWLQVSGNIKLFKL